MTLHVLTTSADHGLGLITFLTFVRVLKVYSIEYSHKLIY
jgi:hypothetical protein